MNVRKAYKITGTFTAPLDLREYPHDRQRLPIRLSLNAIKDLTLCQVSLQKAKFHVGNAFLPRNEFAPYPAIFCIRDETESSLSRCAGQSATAAYYHVTRTKCCWV